MLKTFLNAVVAMDTTTSDGIPDGVAKGLAIDSDSVLLGIIIGVVVSLCFSGIVKYIKWILKDNQKMKDELHEKSDK